MNRVRRRTIVKFLLLFLIGVIVTTILEAQYNQPQKTALVESQQLRTDEQTSKLELGKKENPNEKPERSQTKQPQYCRKSKEYRNSKIGTELDPAIWKKVRFMVLFIGYYRSGHSLVGSLLDAHPNIILSDEMHVIRTWERLSKNDKTRENLFQAIYTNSVQMSRFGERSLGECTSQLGYKYKVPNQWHGRFDRTIQVIGDKLGPQTVSSMTAQPNSFLELQEAVKVPIKFIHVLRNPFDIVGTSIYRKVTDKSTGETLQIPVSATRKIQIVSALNHVRLTKGVLDIIDQYPASVITIPSEDMIANPRKQLKRICQFLSVLCSDDYLNDCSSIVYKSKSKSRNRIIWNNEAKNILHELTKTTPMLHRYNFDE